MIKVLNAIYGGERFEEYHDELLDLGSHLPGFALDKDGLLRASKASISGHIAADSLTAGPLEVSPTAPQIITRNFPVNETAENIFNNMRVYGTWGVTGNYNGPITSVEILQSTSQYKSGLYTVLAYITVVNVNPGTNPIAKTTVEYKTLTGLGGAGGGDPLKVVTHNIKTAYPLTFSTTFEGLTMRLFNLPEIPNEPAETGTVYKAPDGAGGYNLKIKG